MLFDFLFSVCRTRGSGVTVAVLLRWEPPREGDLPVHSYRVTWMSRQTHTAHKHTHTLHGRAHIAHNNMHTRPTHPRTSEGKKESNSRLTQGVRKLNVCLLTIESNTVTTILMMGAHNLLNALLIQIWMSKVSINQHSITHNDKNIHNSLLWYTKLLSGASCLL